MPFTYLEVVQVDAGCVVGPAPVRLRMPEPFPILTAHFVRKPCKRTERKKKRKGHTFSVETGENVEVENRSKSSWLFALTRWIET